MCMIGLTGTLGSKMREIHGIGYFGSVRDLHVMSAVVVLKYYPGLSIFGRWFVPNELLVLVDWIAM